MSVSFVLRLALTLICVLPESVAVSQNIPVIPPGNDPAFWGRSNAPYILKITQTSTSTIGNATPHTHIAVVNRFRDSNGRVREEVFYDNGQPMGVSIDDPGKNTRTIVYFTDKRAVVVPIIRTGSGNGWTVEPLPSRVIDGIQAEGLRFTRTIPATTDGTIAVEEDWISEKLGVVLEQTTSSHVGTTTKTVSEFRQIEPDPALFKIDLSGYSVQQVGTSTH